MIIMVYNWKKDDAMLLIREFLIVQVNNILKERDEIEDVNHSLRLKITELIVGVLLLNSCIDFSANYFISF